MKIKNIKFSFILFIIFIVFTSSYSNKEVIYENILSLIFGDETEYSQNFSKKVFFSIKKNMSKNDVVLLLGEPIIKLGDHEQYWHYSNIKSNKYRTRLIIFDENNKVSKKEIGFYID